MTHRLLNRLWEIPETKRNKGVALLSKIFTNILKDPSNEKYGDLNFDKISAKLKHCKPALYLLFNAGFKQSTNGQRLQWIYTESNLKSLQSTFNALTRKINGKAIIFLSLSTENVHYTKHKKSSLVLINGFVRRIQSLVDDIISIDVVTKCFEFWFIEECFSFVADGAQLSDNNKTVTMENDASGAKSYSHFGNVCIESMSGAICKWKLKVNKGKGCVDIGICSKCDDEVDYFWTNNKTHNYAYGNYGQIFSKGKNWEYSNYWKKAFIGQEIIEMKLDLQLRSIEFYANGTSQGIAFENIDVGNDISYRLAVCTGRKEESVTIQDFEFL